MAALSAQSAIALAIQQVADTVPLLVEASNQLDAKIQDNGRAEQVSNLSYRIPFESALPGSYGLTTLDSSSVALPAGGSSEYQQGTVTPLVACVPIEWTKLAEIVDKPPTAVQSTVTKQMGNAMKVLRQQRDINLCTGDGTGKLGTVISITGNVVEVDSTTYGARVFRKNQFVMVFNGSTLRPSGNTYGPSVMIADLNKQLGQANTITLDTIPAGMAAGDSIMVDGVANGAPVGHCGIPAYLSNSKTGYTLGTSRAGNSWLQSNGFDATGGQVTLPLLRLMLDQIVNNLGPEAVTAGGLLIQTSQGNMAQYEQLGEAYGMIPYEGGKGGSFDGLFRGSKTVDGHPVLVNVHAHASRWDALVIKAWGKVKYGQGTFWFNQDGQTVFPVMGANGSPTSGARSFLIDAQQYYVDNFQAQSSLYNTAPSQGYAVN